MGVSIYRGNPQIIHFSRIFPRKTSILGYPHFRNPPYRLHQLRKLHKLCDVNYDGASITRGYPVLLPGDPSVVVVSGPQGGKDGLKQRVPLHQ